MTTEYLIRREMEHVLAALTPPNRLVCEVCVSTGLRVGDVLAFKSADIKSQFWITERKTGKRRRVNLSGDLLERLRAQAGMEYVFEARLDPHKHRSRQAVWRDVKRAAKAFRLPQNVSIHSLRKYWSVEYLGRVNGDLKKLQKAMNHSSQAITMVYAMSATLYKAKYGDGSGKGKKRRGR